MKRPSLPPLRILLDRSITALERRRTSQLVAVVVVSVTIGALTARLVASAHGARERWTGMHQVLLAARPIADGVEIPADAVTRTALPAALTPDDALVDLPTGARLRLAVEARTVITAALLAKDSAVVPDGWRMVAIPDDVATPPLSAGQSVDVVAGGETLAAGAVVATLEPLTVAVDPGVAAVVAAAARLGEVALVAGG